MTVPDFIIKIFTSPAGSFGTAFAIFVLLFYLTIKAGRIIEKFGLVEKLEKAIDSIKDDISEIKAHISVINSRYSELVTVKSPISLSEKGETVAKKLKVKDIINTKWDSVLNRIKASFKTENNPYNIQEACFEIGKTYSKLVTKEQFDFIKTYAYENGHSLSDFDVLFGIIIRDKYFDSENIDVEEVDTYDPTKK